jgi:hypothetical protein
VLDYLLRDELRHPEVDVLSTGTSHQLHTLQNFTVGPDYQRTVACCGPICLCMGLLHDLSFLCAACVQHEGQTITHQFGFAGKVAISAVY